MSWQVMKEFKLLDLAGIAPDGSQSTNGRQQHYQHHEKVAGLPARHKQGQELEGSQGVLDYQVQPGDLCLDGLNRQITQTAHRGLE